MVLVPTFPVVFGCSVSSQLNRAPQLDSRDSKVHSGLNTSHFDRNLTQLNARTKKQTHTGPTHHPSASGGAAGAVVNFDADVAEGGRSLYKFGQKIDYFTLVLDGVVEVCAVVFDC